MKNPRLQDVIIGSRASSWKPLGRYKGYALRYRTIEWLRQKRIEVEANKLPSTKGLGFSRTSSAHSTKSASLNDVKREIDSQYRGRR